MKRHKTPGESPYDKLQKGRRVYLDDLEQYNDENGPSQIYLESHPEERGVKSSLNDSNIFDSYDNAPTLEGTESFGETVWNGIKWATSPITDSISNYGRLLKEGFNKFGRDWVSQDIDNNLADAYDIQMDNEDLSAVEDYFNLHKRAKEIEKELGDALRINDTQKAQELNQEMHDISNKISDYDKYFMGEGRSHKVIQELMYDDSKMSFGDFAGFLNKSARAGIPDKIFDPNRKWYDIPGDILYNLVSSLGAVTMGPFADVADYISSGFDTRYVTNRYVGSLNSNSDGDKAIINKLYKGSILNKDSISSSLDINRIDQWKKYNEEQLNDIQVDFEYNKQNLKNGNLGVFGLFTIDGAFNPNIPQEYLKEQQDFMGQNVFSMLTSPVKTLLYTIPEIASTVGLFKYQLGAMAADRVMMKSLQFASKYYPAAAVARFPLTAIDVAMGLGAAELSREDETALEKIQAISSRTIQDAKNNGADLGLVINTIKQQLDKMGENTDALDEEQILRAGIAFGIPTGDVAFDNAEKQARQGISALVSANNALAVHDYIQSIPFFTYGGSALSKGFDKLGHLITNNKYGRYLKTAKDYTIGKIADRFIKKDMPKGFLFNKHIKDWILKREALGLYEGITEGGEEIVQEILQSRYQRGLYDNYNYDTSMFPVDGAILMGDLVSEALPDYLGLHPWDPELSSDDIQRAFNVGFLASKYFTGALRFASNAYTQDNENLRSIISQLKNDRVASQLVGTYAQQLQDQQHMDFFYESMQKWGVGYEKLAKALNDLKEGAFPEAANITKEAIDNDLLMLTNLYFASTNDVINKELEKEGIKKGSKEHKAYSINAAKILTDLVKDDEKAGEKLEDLKRREEQRVNAANEFIALLEEEKDNDETGISGTVADESGSRLRALKQQFPKLYQMVQYFSNRYDDAYQRSTALRRQQNVAENIFKLRSEGIDGFLTNADIQEYLDNIYSDFDAQKAIDIYNSDNKEDQKNIRAAYKYAAEKKIKNDWKAQFDEKEKGAGLRQFVSNQYLHEVSRRHGVNIFGEVDWLRDRYQDRDALLEEAYDISRETETQKQIYVRNHIALFNEASRMARTKYNKEMTDNQEKLLTEIRRITGLDLDTRRLRGIKAALEKQIEQLKKYEKDVITSNGKLETSIETFSDYFKSAPIAFDDQEDYDRTYGEYSLLKALRNVHSVIASAYSTGKVNPELIEEALYNTSEDNPISKISTEYRKRKAETSSLADEDVTKPFDPLKKHDLEELSKKAAKAMILDQIRDTEVRRKIANREWEKENPIGPEEIEQRVEENEKAEQEAPAKEETAPEAPATPVDNQTPSDAEKRLSAEFFGPEKSEKKKKEEAKRLAEAAKREEGAEEEETPVKETPEEAPEEALEEPETNEQEEGAPEQEGGEVLETPEETTPSENIEIPVEPKEKKEEQEIPVDDPVDPIEYPVDEPIEIPVDLEQPISIENLIWNDAEDTFAYIDPETGAEISIDHDTTQQILLDATLSEINVPTPSDYDSAPNGRMTPDERSATLGKDDMNTLVSNTFFYRDTPQYDDGGREVVVHMKVGKKELKFNKPVAPGWQLGKKLVQPGWLAKTKKYFVVSDPYEGVAERKLKGTDDRDLLTVALAIEDENNTYLLFLLPIAKSWYMDGRGQLQTDNKESEVIDRVLMYGADFNKVEQVLELNAGTVSSKDVTTAQKLGYYKLAVATITNKYLEGLYTQFKGVPGNQSKQKSQFFSDEWKNGENFARTSLAKYGKKIFSRTAAEAEVQKMRDFRNAIIDLYTTKKNGKIVVPSEVRTDIVPNSTQQTNGRFDNARDGENPIFRPIHKGSTEEIQEALVNGDLQIGYGHGMFARKSRRFQISNVFDKSVVFGGKGLSGKLYWMVSSLTKPDTNVPVQLVEELFNTQRRIVNGKTTTLRFGKNRSNSKGIIRPVLCLEKDNDGHWVNTNKDGWLPSAAEIIYLLLTRQINFGVQGKVYDDIVKMFINDNKNTLLKYQPKLEASPVKAFLTKQLFYGSISDDGTSEAGLHIAIDTPKGVEMRHYTNDQLQNDPNVKAEVIYAIASQFHWNTDKDFMKSALKMGITKNTAFSNLFEFMKKNHEGEITEDTELSLFGCPQLSFRVGDLATVGKNGKITAKKNISYLSWMIKNQKVKTDVSEQIFYAPFVYAHGVQNKEQQNKQFEQAAENLVEDSSKEVIQLSEANIDNNPVVYAELGGRTVLPEGKDLRTAMESIQTKLAKDNDGIKEIFLFKGMTPDEPLSEKQSTDALIAKIKAVLDQYNKKNNTSYTVDGYKFAMITKNAIVDTWAVGDGYAKMYLCGNGKIHIVIKRNLDTTDNDMVVSGVFQTQGGNGTIDVQKERKWLEDTLGIPEEDVVVTNAIMRSVKNEAVYGVVQTALDVITGRLGGFITISAQGDAGMGYHEAWHYINLLIHDSATRRRIYDAYKATHKNLNKPGVKYRDVEEAMADEFARDVLLDQDHSVSGIIRRFFRNVADFILFTGNRHAYRKVFNAVKAGKYKGAELNPQSVMEFEKAYQQGAFSSVGTSAAIPKSLVKKLNNIKYYYELLDGTEAVMRAIFNMIPFATKEKLQQWNGTAGVDMILETVDQMISEQEDEDLIGILEDLKLNPNYLMKCLRAEFKKYGIDVRVDRQKENSVEDDETVSITQENLDATKKEDKPDNTWDKFHLESKRKDNVSNTIKFFLSKIPKFKKVWHNNGKVSYVYDRDKFGTAMFFDLDKVLRKVHQELWWIQSFGELETQPHSKYTYKRTSLMGAIERRKDAQEFYYSLWEYLQPYASGKARQSKEIRSGLFNAINSSKQHIDVLTIKNPAVRKYIGSVSEQIGEIISSSLDEGSFVNMSQTDKAVADREREWEFQNEESINVARNLMFQWSKGLASSGFTTFDSETKTVKANVELGQSFKTRFDQVKKEISEAKSNKTTNVALNDLKLNLIKLLNDLAIDCDMSSFGVFLYAMSGITGKELTKEQQIDTLNKIVTDNSIGSIGWIINDLAGVKNKGEAKSGRQKFGRELDEMYQQYPMDSQIAKLALSWNAAYPTPFEFSVTDANNNRLYPVNLNCMITDRITWMNDPDNGFVEDLKQSPYSAGSILVEIADNVDPEDPNSQIQLRTFVGVKDGDSNIGGDYFGITPQEDYIAKMMMTEKDCIIFPTMADKKTWFSIFCKNLTLSHMPMLIFPDYDKQNEAIYSEYSKIDPFIKEDPRWNGLSRKWRKAARDWFGSLDDQDPVYRKIKKQGLDGVKSSYGTKFGFVVDYKNFQIVPRYDNSTLQRFAMYFKSELSTLREYYSEDNIKAMVEDPSERYENFSGSVDAKTGRLNCDGNGGFFRYFYDSLDGLNSYSKYKIYDEEGNEINNLNHYIQALFQLQKKIMESSQNNASAEENDQFKKLTAVQVFGKDIDELDGFELIRDFLKTLEDSLNQTKNNDRLMDNINQKLIGMVYTELDTLTKETSPIKLGTYNKETGIYIPTGVPEQLLKPYIDEYVKAGIAAEQKHLYNHDQNTLANAFFSLVANHVANTATSVIEVEKVITGDPAQFKRKTNIDDPTQTLSVSVKFDKNSSVKDVEITVTNLYDTFADKIKRLGGTLSPGSEVRPDYSEEEIAMDPSLGFTQYTNLAMEDINAPSVFLEEVKQIFKTQLIVDHLRTIDKMYIDRVKKYIQKSIKDDKEMSDERVLDFVYSNQKYADEAYNILPKESKSAIESEFKAQIKPYEKVKEVANAQVFIRPELYRKIRIGLGQWSFVEDADGYSDEKAYRILEEGKGTEWMSDKAKAKLVKRFQLYPLKMSYYQNDLHTTKGGYSYMKSIYDKMAIFPLFKFTRSSEVGDALYRRMNMEGNQIDMITFKSAIKVGAPQEGAQPVASGKNAEDVLSSIGDYLDKKSNKYIDYKSRTVKENIGDNLLTVEVQDVKNLRMQLNTEAHEAEMRAIGTQMFKIAFSNIIDDSKYGTRKSGRNPRKGSDIKHQIIQCINALTQLGIFSVDQKFYTGGQLDSKKVQNFILEIIDNNDLGDVAREIITNGGVASGIVKRQVFENSASSFVNKNIVDIKTQGGTAIQQSVFGFAGMGNENVGIQYNGGKELKWSAKEGSMEVLLSMNFFRAIIPNYADKTFDERRAWLIDHNIIKGAKSDGSQSDPSPFGIGYRIPTQGMSSMFSFIVADVLPEQSGDLIIVPREFVAQTGSDFDVDKLYIATYAYDKEGNRLTIDKEEIKKINDMDSWDDSKDINEVKKAIANELLTNYNDIITDIKNYSDSRASIDVITEQIHTDFLDVVRQKKKGYISGLTELTPSFQAIKKMEFGVGKDGIGPFALNITNLALTQYSHLTIDFGDTGKSYGLNPLDRIYGKDKRRISAWLSAMVNAHVDVAKDPYVFDLNLNQATYNHANLLLRAGMGMSTFTFLAQPILKYFADTLNNAGGLYGKNIDGNEIDDPQESFKKKLVSKNLLKLYYDKLESLVNEYHLEDDYSKHMKFFKEQTKDKKEKESAQRPKDDLGSKKNIFDEQLGKSSILAYVENENDINQSNVEGHVRSMIFQMYCLLAFNELDIYAKDLSQLVKYSGIDTKKFGKTSFEKTNFDNNMQLFINQSSHFTVTDKQGYKKITKDLKKKDNDQYDPHEVSVNALNYYFNSLFLSKKLKNANKYVFDILSTNLFTSTPQFNAIMRNILRDITGDPELEDLNGKKLLLYKQMYNPASLKALYQAADNMVRFNVLTYYGPSIYEKELKDHPDSVMLDFTERGDIRKAVERYQTLLFGNKEQDSIFVRLRNLMHNIKHDTSGAYIGLGYNGQILNDLLKFLSPLTPSKDNSIGRMILSHSQTDNRNQDEIKLQAAFGQLLEHPNERVRKLAEDLAFYAFYSTYDQNVVNSFFHLVPAQYRRQYDKSLAVALAKLKKDKISKADAIRAMGGLGRSKQSTDMDILLGMAATNIHSTISRNYWYDQNIVHVHYIPRILGQSGFQSTSNVKAAKVKGESEEIVGRYAFIKDVQKQAPIWIATAREDALYFQTRDRILYRRIGKVLRSHTDKESGKVFANSTFYVYAVAQKAGFKNKKQSLYELFCGQNDQSIFEQSVLPKIFSETNVRKEIEEKVEKEKGGYNTLKVVWDNEDVPEIYADTNTDMFVDSGDKVTSENQGWVNGKLITCPKENGIDWKGQRAADVIVNITLNPVSGKMENVPENLYEKAVNVAINGQNLDDAIQRIKEISDGSPIVVHFTSPARSNKDWRSMLLDDSSIKEYVDQYKQWLSSKLESDPNLDEIISQRVEDIKNDPKHMDAVARRVFGDFMDNLVTQMDAAGIEFKYLSGYMKASNTILASGINTVYEHNTDLVEPGSAVLYIPQSYQSVKRLAMDISELNSITVNEDVEHLKNQVDVAPKPKNTSKIEKIVEQQEQKNRVVFRSARSGEGYEVSSKGDKRFSALYATFKEGTVIFGHDVSGQTIESVYQHGVKQGDWETIDAVGVKNGTGAPKSKEIITGNTEKDSYDQGYLPLWREWASQNPELMQELFEKAIENSGTLKDKFASTYSSQARALAEILNDQVNNAETKTEPEEKEEEPVLPIIKQAEESEQNNHENCGVGGSKGKKKPNFDKLKKSAGKVDDYEV